MVQKLCVTSNTGQIDSSLINYSKMLNYAFSNTIDSINFLHFSPNHNLPESILRQFPTLEKSNLIDETKELIKDIYGYRFNNIEFSFLTNNYIDSFSNFENTFCPDFYLIGIKKTTKIIDFFSLILIKNTKQNTLFIPEGISAKITNILVPIDFSESSYHSLEIALKFSKKHNATIEALYSYEIPSSYHMTGKSYTEFATLIKKEIKEKFSSIEKKLNISIKLSIQINNQNTISDKVSSYAKENNKDFIVIGHNQNFLGKITEELLGNPITIPFFIVKNQNMYVKV